MKITLDITLSDEMREDLKEVGVEVLGVKESGTFISLVTDTAIGVADDSITPNDDIRIGGDKLRIAPDSGEGLGVFFVNEAGKATPVNRLTQNGQKTLIASVPALPVGEYTLRVVTRFTKNNLLN